jgi:acyl transferase domain-containing protein/NAD(P)-dependent dehydrogenase (short-subunit alcohol dehydrogenase family)/acyl carrier protein
LWRKALRDCGVADEVADQVVERISRGYVGWQENSFPGLLGNVVAGRVANRLDLNGTNCVVDAACASSLSAIHLAALELQSGRCDVAVTGGVDTFNDIFMYMCFSKTPALSPTGDAKPFATDADGTILGEGLGIVVLKRLADAERDGNRIYAVIKGMGTSSDGKGNAIYAPSSAGQVDCLRDAYRAAGVTPDTIELIEAHGTGTKVGDAAEMAGLTEVFRDASMKRSWCALGSVKSQLGHTKAAAGAAGLIKAALALYHKVLPPTIKVANPLVEPGATPFYVNTECRPWLPRDAHPRRAGVSAFGFGGSNFHCVLEEHDRRKPEIDWPTDITIFALCDSSIRGLQSRLPTATDWPSLCAGAADSRRTFDPAAAHRLLVVVQRSQLPDFDAIRTWLADPSQPTREGCYYGEGSVPGGLGFLFPGQGAQSVGMLRDLACTFPVMQDVLAEADRAFAAGLADPAETRLSDFIYPQPAFTPEARTAHEEALRSTPIAQPALGAVSLGAMQVLAHFGVKPQATAGHSYGELTALCAAGCFEAPSLFELSQLRGRLMANPSSDDAGGMLAVQAPLEAVESLIRSDQLDLVIANKNSPTQAVLSGRVSEIDRAAKALQSQRIANIRLPVAAAFHSASVAGATKPFRAALEPIVFHTAQLPVYANTTGRVFPRDPQAIRDLLAEQIAKPVEFVEQIRNMADAGLTTFLEVGPGRTLTRLVGSILGDRPHTAIALDSSAGKRTGLHDLAHALAQLAAIGYPVDLARWDPDAPPAPTAKPALTIPICGANYRKPQPELPPPKFPPPQLSRRPHLEPKLTPTMAKNSTGDSSNLQRALAVSQESLAAFQKLQEQTAQLHKQFLESQEVAQRTLQTLVEGQQRIVSASLGISVSAPPIPAPAQSVVSPAIDPQRIGRERAPTSTPSPIIERPQIQPDEPGRLAVGSPAGETNGKLTAPTVDRGHIERTLIAIIAEKTGYPPDMLGLDMGLDADLGIDSIKRVEILSALQDKLPEAPIVKPEHLGTLHTLREIVEFLCGGEAPSASQPLATETKPVASSQGLDRQVIRATELATDSRSVRSVPAGSLVWIVADSSPLANELSEHLRQRKLKLHVFSWDAPLPAAPASLSGLALIAGDRADVARKSLPWLQLVGPALKQSHGFLTTVTHLDGLFGFSGAGPQCKATVGALAGLAKTASHEWQGVACKAIDLSSDAPVHALADELFREGPLEVGITGAGRHSLELVSAPLPAIAAIPLGSSDVVVITGGARGVTAEVAVELARSGATLVLLGRSPDPSAESAELAACADEVAIKRLLSAQNGRSLREIDAESKTILAAREIRGTLERITAAGGKVLYRSVDIRDVAAVRAALDGIGAITGVIHGAGVLADRRLEDLTVEQFDSVYETKVGGLRNLLASIGEQPLKFLVLFSSSTGRFGRTGQAAPQRSSIT